MSKLVLDLRVPASYDKSILAEVIRAICTQVNTLSEGRVTARYQAQVSVPTSVAAAVSDITWDSNATVTNGTIRIGWISNVGSQSNATFQEIRALASSSLTLAQLNALISDADVGVTLGTEVAATSGTSIDFTGIPSWAKKIVIQFFGVSTTGTSPILVQLGDAGGIETTGYLGSGGGIATGVSAAANHTAGFGIADATAGTAVYHGAVTLTLEDSAAFTWIASSVMGRSEAGVVNIGGGSKSLSAALDRVRITTTGGSETFDLGAINIQYQ